MAIYKTRIFHKSAAPPLVLHRLIKGAIKPKLHVMVHGWAKCTRQKYTIKKYTYNTDNLAYADKFGTYGKLSQNMKETKKELTHERLHSCCKKGPFILSIENSIIPIFGRKLLEGDEAKLICPSRGRIKGMAFVFCCQPCARQKVRSYQRTDSFITPTTLNITENIRASPLVIFSTCPRHFLCKRQYSGACVQDQTALLWADVKPLAGFIRFSALPNTEILG